MKVITTIECATTSGLTDTTLAKIVSKRIINKCFFYSPHISGIRCRSIFRLYFSGQDSTGSADQCISPQAQGYLRIDGHVRPGSQLGSYVNGMLVDSSVLQPTSLMFFGLFTARFHVVERKRFSATRRAQVPFIQCVISYHLGLVSSANPF